MKEGPSESKENKENREKKGEREASKGRAAANRKGKGASRSRQGIVDPYIGSITLIYILLIVACLLSGFSASCLIASFYY